MKKYIEIGIGNSWFVRTEFEHPDGTEYEVKGAKFPITVRSLYFRIWIGKKVWIIDTREGIKLSRKDRRKLKIVAGIAGE
jgi:hypothetical protein